MTSKKCPACGGTDLVPYQFASYTITEFRPFMDAFMCADCGRLEFYALEDRRKSCVDSNRARAAEEKEKSIQIEQLESQLADLKRELERCNAIADDENQTVKAVKEAKFRIQDLSNEICNVEARLAAVKKGSPVPDMIINSDCTYHS